MNFNKEHNVFSDIPGFDASKGERIVKALQRLWKKIEHLEQIRISESKSRSKEVQTSSNDEDLTVTDVQFKLLVLQLQYVRSILRKKIDKSNKGDKTSHVYYTNDPGSYELQDLDGKAVSQETQTGSSLIEEWSPHMNSSVPRNSKRIDTQVSANSQILRSEDVTDKSQTVTGKILQNTSKPHYHLKLDDVPFILGASSTASHSVVANVQNIIAMMKSHNKALCGLKPNVYRSSAVSTHSATEDSQDAAKMLNQLSQDLHELALRQEDLAKKFDAAQEENQVTNFKKSFQAEDKRKINKPVSIKNVIADTRCRSNSESSVKLHADINNFSTIKGKVQQKQNLTTIKGHSSNLPIMARRKLLRSLQNFKTHLSEEDILWD